MRTFEMIEARLLQFGTLCIPCQRSAARLRPEHPEFWCSCRSGARQVRTTTFSKEGSLTCANAGRWALTWENVSQRLAAPGDAFHWSATSVLHGAPPSPLARPEPLSLRRLPKGSAVVIPRRRRGRPMLTGATRRAQGFDPGVIDRKVIQRGQCLDSSAQSRDASHGDLASPAVAPDAGD